MKKIILLLLLTFSLTLSQTTIPKYEMRGVWIASLGIDWPSNTGTTTTVMNEQKNQLQTILNSHRSYGLNAVYFHIRPLCDAAYKSSIEPWSRFITGQQGAAPTDPTYDPLQFAIEESHKRGMELHAWLNPYRALQTTGSVSSLSPNHVINTHPEWIIKCNGTEYRFLNPGLPEVRNYVTSIVMDIARRYNVDGIHFDDYFYPYSEYGAFNDDAAFQLYPNGFTDKASWRKNNVNLLLKMINDSLKAVKPYVKFGVSPSGNPSVNNSIFITPADWLKGAYRDVNGILQQGDPYIDYIMPQLYWVSYNNQLGNWSGTTFLNGRDLYIGLPAYRYVESGWSPGEISWEMKTNRSTPTIKGGVFFSSRSLISNLAGCNDSLEYNYHSQPSVTPKMAWLPGSNTQPNAPTNLRYEYNLSTSNYELLWDKPTATLNGDTAVSYLVYRFTSAQGNVNEQKNIFGHTGVEFLEPTYARFSVTEGNYYGVTAFDRYSNESSLSNIIMFDTTGLIPGSPNLLTPANGANNLTSTTTLSWAAVPNSLRYRVQIATDPLFTDIIYDLREYRSTSAVFSKIAASSTYYWRVRAYGFGGGGEYSAIHTFKSGIPSTPTLLEPTHANLNVPLNPTFKWTSIDNAANYKFQLATNSNFSTGVIKDTTINDTTIYVENLEPLKNHFWRVAASNPIGTSAWTQYFGFKTGTTIVGTDEENVNPANFKLDQNYPNPFNPSTLINYEVPAAGLIRLSVFDVMGREVAELVNEMKTPGKYSVEFNTSAYGENFSSGVYFVELRSGTFRSVKKLMFLK
jgi:uncharacterized lipoprotein YddW (UPF0748 family)